MFDSIEDANRYFVENFKAPYVEMLAKALTPAISFEPAPDTKLVIGGTRIGGNPDLPPTLPWPRGTKPENAQEIAERANDELTKEILAHFELGLPYTFFAQIDLTAAAGLGAVAADLPREGRLLFFYDEITGPWENGTRAARVLWDTSPVVSLKTAPNPADLQQAIDRYRQAEPSAAGAATPYGAPGREMLLKPKLRMPNSASLEIDKFPKLRDALLAAQQGDDPDGLWDTYSSDFDYGQRNQLLGGLDPVQDDPRYEAVAVSDFNTQFFNSEMFETRRDEIDSKAREWRLLLQFDYNEFYQSPADGTLYFLIRDADLKARRFDRVISVYQQT